MRTVLVIEDDPNASELLELLLMRIPGVAVCCLDSVEQARRTLATAERFDALITDVHLPGEDGLSLVASLRQMPDRRHIPVIILTSSPEPDLRRRAEAMGVHAFLRKPWSPTALRDTIHSLFNET